MLDSLKIKDKIFDSKLEALNVLCTLSIGDYIGIADNIKNNNDFQRRKVQSRSTVYSLLKEDLVEGCIIPSIVLAIDEETIQGINANSEDQMLSELIKTNVNKLKILDGLQRTNILLDITKELNNLVDNEKLQALLKRDLRLEIYVGISRFGILYRMLTLNTGQTAMSLRHQIEILYSDLFDKTIGDITLLRDATDHGVVKPQIGRYYFSEIVEGVTSYIEGSEFTLDRFDLLDYIKTLKKLSKENLHQDIFKSFLGFYHLLLTRLVQSTGDWKYDYDTLLQEQQELIKFNADKKDVYVFGNNVTEIFTKTQIYTALGAALFTLKKKGIFQYEIPFLPASENIVFPISVEYSLNNLIVRLAQVRKNAKKIGDEQRTFFRHFFEYFFNSNDSQYYLNFDESIDSAYKKLFSV